ncbi:cupin domain-containing protein, partial [uncultured Acinetobacter sp.]
MDALSKIFDDIHLNKSEFIYLNPQGNWAFQYQDHSAIIAYVVLSGELYLELSTQRQVYAQAGDIVLIPS